jgi:acyl-CoA reductase-like NAD-dependent aldehyde dehydrogenase
VGAASAAFKEWSKTPPSKRRAILWKAADLLEARAKDVAATITAETGGTFGWGMFNTFFAASIMREAAATTTQLTGETIPSDIPGNIALSVRQGRRSLFRGVNPECGRSASPLCAPESRSGY